MRDLGHQQNLEEMMSRGTFAPTNFWINVVPDHSSCDSGEDIPLWSAFSGKTRTGPERITPEAMDVLAAYEWQGMQSWRTSSNSVVLSLRIRLHNDLPGS
jgi:hypothetical protein